MTITEIKSLPVSERMLLMEEIWDSLCHEQKPMASGNPFKAQSSVGPTAVKPVTKF